MKDITSIEDIKKLVDTFYESVRADELISPIFNERIQNRWPQHLEKMYTFWQTLLLNEQTYFGSPFPPHATLPVSGVHFNRWIELFTKTVDQLFSGNVADEAKWRAERMAEVFETKIAFNQKYPLV